MSNQNLFISSRELKSPSITSDNLATNNNRPGFNYEDPTAGIVLEAEQKLSKK